MDNCNILHHGLQRLLLRVGWKAQRFGEQSGVHENRFTIAKKNMSDVCWVRVGILSRVSCLISFSCVFRFLVVSNVVTSVYCVRGACVIRARQWLAGARAFEMLPQVLFSFLFLTISCTSFILSEFLNVWLAWRFSKYDKVLLVFPTTFSLVPSEVHLQIHTIDACGFNSLFTKDEMMKYALSHFNILFLISVRPDPPENVQLRVVNENAIQVTFDAPARHLGAIVTRYKGTACYSNILSIYFLNA